MSTDGWKDLAGGRHDQADGRHDQKDGRHDEPAGRHDRADGRYGQDGRTAEQYAGAQGDQHADPQVDRPGSDGEHLVQQRLGTTDRADRFYRDQVLDHLNDHMREFVGRQEMFFLATADRHGECDSTFRAGPPGFVQVLDGTTLAYPEYRGNGVMASVGNISENPRLGILFVDFLRDRIGLHVNGRARVVLDDEMRARHPQLPVDPVPGRRAQLWVEVEVEEAYIHCAKHIPHLQKVPRQERGERAWGTDDVKRKGGDFFRAAAEREERAPYRRPPVKPEVPFAPEPPRTPPYEPAYGASPAEPVYGAPPTAPAAAYEPVYGAAYEAPASAYEAPPISVHETPPAPPVVPVPPVAPAPASPLSFQEEAARVLALAQQRAPVDDREFRGWFG